MKQIKLFELPIFQNETYSKSEYQIANYTNLVGFVVITISSQDIWLDHYTNTFSKIKLPVIDRWTGYHFNINSKTPTEIVQRIDELLDGTDNDANYKERQWKVDRSAYDNLKMHIPYSKIAKSII